MYTKWGPYLFQVGRRNVSRRNKRLQVNLKPEKGRLANEQQVEEKYQIDYPRKARLPQIRLHLLFVQSQKMQDIPPIGL